MREVDMLRFPTLFCWGLYCFIAIAAIYTTGIFVNLQINPQDYAHWNAIAMFPKGTLTYTFVETWSTVTSNGATLLSFDKINTSSLYFNYFQILAVLFLAFISVRELLNIIRSVGQIDTFHKRNILSFQKISKYLFVIFILLGFTFISAPEASLRSYSLQLTPLMLSLAALLLAEIFKRGNELLEENRLTI